jgi:hypothetical protein
MPDVFGYVYDSESSPADPSASPERRAAVAALLDGGAGGRGRTKINQPDRLLTLIYDELL